MRTFLKGMKLWFYAIGDVKQPVKEAIETYSKFEVHIDDWDNNNHKTITWITITFISSMNMSFRHFETAIKVWDFLSARYAFGNLAEQYQLLISLQQMMQSPGHYQ